jgi:hypothetical protein
VLCLAAAAGGGQPGDRLRGAGAGAQAEGWSPEAVESAYKLPVARNSHQTVAVSIAFDTPKLARYLAVYRKHYGLPPCTVASGCLRIVNQRGKASPLPRELDFLAFLARNAGKVCTRRMILENVWGPGYASELHYLKVYAYRIRRKLGDEQGNFLQSDPSVGYRLAWPNGSAARG